MTCVDVQRNVLQSGQQSCHWAWLFIVSARATAKLRNAATGGLSAAAYLRAAYRWMPNFLAIPPTDRPRALDLCTAFHRAFWRGAGFLRVGVPCWARCCG